MFQRAIGEILPFGNPLWRRVALDQNTGNAPLTKLHGQRDSDRPAPHDDYLIALFHRNSVS